MKREKKLQITTETAIGYEPLLGTVHYGKFWNINSSSKFYYWVGIYNLTDKKGRKFKKLD